MAGTTTGGDAANVVVNMSGNGGDDSEHTNPIELMETNLRSGTPSSAKKDGFLIAQTTATGASETSSSAGATALAKDAEEDVMAEFKEETLGARKEKEAMRKVKFTELFRYATTLDVILMSVGMFAAAAAGAALPFTTVLFGNLVNTFAQPPGIISPNITETEKWELISAWRSKLTSDVSMYTLDFIYLAIITFVTTYVYTSFWVMTGERISHSTREHYLKAVLRQNIGWHDSEGAGEVATRITSDMLLIQDAISEKVPIAASQAFTFIASFGIAFWRSWRLTLVLMSVIPLIVVSAIITNTFAARFQAKILQMYSKAGTIAEETLSSVRTVTAFNGQKKMTARYGSELGGARDAGIRKSIVSGLGVGTLFMFIYLAYSLAFYYGGVLLASGQIDAGSVVNVFFAVLVGAFALGQIAPEMQAFAFGMGAGGKIFSTLDRVPSIDTQDEGGLRIPEEEVKGKIELKNVEFTYPARPDVKILKGLSLIIEPGTTVALVGQSGSGKSTIIQLLERFYDATSGQVVIDGHNITEFNLLWLRQHIGYVSQEPTLFEGSVADNVAQGLTGSMLANADAQKKRSLIEDACKMANAHEFILALPQGYDTQVGERGLLLSGGQKQRIAIARAIIKNPKILLLDEATSALDTTSERIVQAALDNAAKGRTTVVIAHRLSTIRDADKIVVMTRGEIIESGNHQELVALDGFYKKLVDAQHLNQEEGTAASVADLKKSAEDIVDDDKGGIVIEDGAVAKATKVDTTSRRNSQFQSLRKMSNIQADEETGDKKTPKMSTVAVVSAILALNKPELKYTVVGLIGATIAGMVIPAFSISFSSILSAFGEEEPQRTNDIHFWAGMFVLIALVTGFTNFIQNCMFGLANEFLTERVRKLLFAAFLRQNIAFFDDDSHTTGVLTSNLATDAQKVQGAAGVTLGTILQLSATLIGGLIVALAYGWKLALVAMTLLPFLVLAGAFRLQVLNYFAEKAKKSYERSAQVACESVAAIRTVQSLTTEKKVHDGYMRLLDGPLRDGYKNALVNTVLYAISQCANFMGNALVFYYGGQLIAYEGYDLKKFFVIFMAVIFGSISAGRIFAFIPDLTKAKTSAEYILDMLNKTPVIDSESEEGEDIKIDQVEGLVEFRNIKFVYPTRPNVRVLRGLNITVKPGQFVALVGPSGCGKSTTIGLVERFYDPIEGALLLDNRDIRKLKLSQYRDVIGLVSQEPNLFDISIEENIAFGCKTPPPKEDIERAAKDANIHEFIMSLPEGYKTLVGSKGSQLSGGQKQRIAIARALVRNPKVLLLDEATSALDAESEKVVQNALDKAAKGRTTIAIAHRLSSIQNADVIYVLKDGVVAESGTHSELFKMRGLYHDLVIQQDLDSKKKKEKA
ncbi:GTPase-activating protein [Blyttiomyces sp. JEL0837]|nr:GTPase-activating protein [Blyttiomyces sp. JEL0837]